MNKLLTHSFTWGVSITTTIFTFVPDSMIGSVKLYEKLSDAQNLLINRISILIIVFITSFVLNFLFFLLRRKIIIKGTNYCVQVEYGDLFRCKQCQKIIAFDECFTTTIGTAPHEIKAKSICGQYLTANPNLDIDKLIYEAGLQPEEGKSEFNNQTKYASGSVVPNGDDLLMAFAKLDVNGRGYFPTRESYLNALTVMWAEIHKYYRMIDVCIPVLGGGVTTIGDSSPSQQELIDYIITSYRLFASKIKNPQKLRIVCRKKDGISLNKIGEMI